MKKIILVDGNNLLFRSFYATAYQGVIMRNSKGFPTNALYGFINMMNKIIKEENPNYIMVAFDKGKTFRHEKYDEYKAGRAAMPEDLGLQFPKAKEVLDAMGIKHFEIENYEADDIIGTLSKKVDEESDFVGTIISSDKDLLQLISDEVDVKLLKQSGHILMDKTEFRNTYKVDPIKMIDLKALMGDASDHIPGVKGIGEKTAINLLEKYGSLDGVYENLESISPKTREKLTLDKENAYMSHDLATIYREVPLGFDLEDCVYNGCDLKRLKEMLEEFEFHSLIKKMDFSEVESEEESADNDIFIDDKDFDLRLKFVNTLTIFCCNVFTFDSVISLNLFKGNLVEDLGVEWLKAQKIPNITTLNTGSLNLQGEVSQGRHRGQLIQDLMMLVKLSLIIG